jgi:hypothetical protein
MAKPEGAIVPGPAQVTFGEGITRRLRDRSKPPPEPDPTVELLNIVGESERPHTGGHQLGARRKLPQRRGNAVVAIALIADVDWLPNAVTMRVLDLDGRHWAKARDKGATKRRRYPIHT